MAHQNDDDVAHAGFWFRGRRIIYVSDEDKEETKGAAERVRRLLREAAYRERFLAGFYRVRDQGMDEPFVSTVKWSDD